MRRALQLFVLLLTVLSAAPTALAGAKVRVYSHEGPIYGIPAKLLEHAIEGAEEENVALLLIELDTPGGDVLAMREMVEQILNSPVPVAVYVTPRGAWAASAGFFLLMAADVAAMAPLTTTGAASPIMMGAENKGDDIPFRKASQDAAALIRSAATLRDRPADLAEKAVFEAISWSSEEALEVGLIDLIAADRDELLAKLHGLEVIRGDGSRVVLDLAEPEIEELQHDWVDEFQKFLFHPAVLLILSSLAMTGIYIEFTNPGLIFPGVVGVICLLIVLYGAQTLPFNMFAVALIVVGLILFFLEIKIISYGLLSLAGTACLGIGMFMLFPRSIPGLAVPMGTIVAVTLFTAACISAATWMVARTLRGKIVTGREGVVGLVGNATTELAPEGTVFVRGEYWTARTLRPIAKGAPVRVVASEGLRLLVEAIAETERVHES